MLNTNRVVVFLDSCFSGNQSRTDVIALLNPDKKPVLISIPQTVPQNIVGIASSSNNQTSNAYVDKAHGLFTYFLLKGIGEMRQGEVPLSELSSYVTNRVEDGARTLPKISGEQRPTPLGHVENFYFTIEGK